MSATLRRISRALLLGLALVSAPVTPQGLVLCVSSGDHFAFEPAVELVPCGAPAVASAGELGSPMAESCTDFALLEASIPVSGGTDLQPPPAMWTSVVAPPPRLAVALTQRDRVADRGFSSALRARRTVVLIV